MFKNIFWMGLSTATRLGANLVLFVLIARGLGPAEFGHYMFWYGITYLCSMFSNYGLGNVLLKEVAQYPEKATNLLNEALSLRIMLSLGILVVAVGIAALADRPELLFAFLFAHFVEAFSEMFFVSYRALGHYSREAQLAACVAVIQLALIFVALLFSYNTGVIAFTFMVGKIVQLVLIMLISKNIFGKFEISFRSALNLAKRTKAYAIDSLLTCTFGYIDNIILRIFAGVDVIGIYQSGMRIFQGGSSINLILAYVFLPTMAKQQLQKENKNSSITLQVAFLVFGGFFGLTLAYFSKLITSIFGAGYGTLATLLPLFGLLFFIRCFAVAWGVVLIATDQQGYRAKANALHLLFTLLLGSYLTYSLQAQGWLVALVLANLLLGILYMFRAIREGFSKPAKISVCIIIMGSLLFIPLLF